MRKAILTTSCNADKTEKILCKKCSHNCYHTCWYRNPLLILHATEKQPSSSLDQLNCILYRLCNWSGKSELFLKDIATVFDTAMTPGVFSKICNRIKTSLIKSKIL